MPAVVHPSYRHVDGKRWRFAVLEGPAAETALVLCAHADDGLPERIEDRMSAAYWNAGRLRELVEQAATALASVEWEWCRVALCSFGDPEFMPLANVPRATRHIGAWSREVAPPADVAARLDEMLVARQLAHAAACSEPVEAVCILIERRAGEWSISVG